MKTAIILFILSLLVGTRATGQCGEDVFRIGFSISSLDSAVRAHGLERDTSTELFDASIYHLAGYTAYDCYGVSWDEIYFQLSDSDTVESLIFHRWFTDNQFDPNDPSVNPADISIAACEGLITRYGNAVQGCYPGRVLFAAEKGKPIGSWIYGGRYILLYCIRDGDRTLLSLAVR